MPPHDSAALIVARFLKANHFNESYETFVREAGLSENAGTLSKGDLTLEVLLEEKKTFDLSVRFEKLGTSDDVASGWTTPAPSTGHEIDNLPAKANILSTVVETTSEDGASSKPLLLTSAADRRLHMLEMPSCSLRRSISSLHDSPILTCAVFGENVLLTGTMSGTMLASDFHGNILDKRSDHSKYVVRVCVLKDDRSSIIATAGWDNKIYICHPTRSPNETSSSTFNFNDPVSTLTLQTKPEALLFIHHPDDDRPILVLTRTDSNFLYYYDPTIQPSPRLLGQQNLAPHSNAWISFTPSSLALHPSDPTLVAVGTNSVPHMKLLIVRLLFPAAASLSDREAASSNVTSGAAAAAAAAAAAVETQANETPAAAARAALARADREAEAIRIHCNTQAPQTAYSTPAVAWRPDGSGVWVNGDDGAVRGVEAVSGKVVATLREGGHEDGSKVRCLWAGEVGGEEVLVSGGFDRRLVVWRVK